MRITQQIKSKKSSYRHKVRKKRHKSRSTIGCTPGVSILDLENINEVLRINRVLLRNQCAKGRGAWKIVPKDSCEVYKDRRKRQAENSRRDQDAEMDSDEDESDRKKKKYDKKNRKGSPKKTKRKQKPRRRREENSSLSSYTTTTTSCMSSSEMDYE